MTAAKPVAAASALTDGTGVSRLTHSKVLKDFVADLLLSAPIALLAVNVTDLSAAVAVPTAALFALGDTGIRVVYRAALRWATT